MRAVLGALLIALATPAATALAQGGPLSGHTKFTYGVLKKMLVRSAELMPEEHYGFKPTDVVRSFGQIVGHMADAHYYHCSAVLGEKNPSLKIEQTKSTKAELIAALKEALTYCDRAYDGMTDATATQTVRLSGYDMPKLGVLNINQIHAGLHYGNFVTYLRLKNIVPPTSEPGFSP
jgi:uncharacterized damage-inducible protein DinB